jgi:hypothetical protein
MRLDEGFVKGSYFGFFGTSLRLQPRRLPLLPPEAAIDPAIPIRINKILSFRLHNNTPHPPLLIEKIPIIHIIGGLPSWLRDPARVMRIQSPKSGD